MPSGEPRAGGEPGRQHGGERHDALDREVHVPGDDAEGQADRQQAHEGRVLQDVDEDPDLEEVLDRDRADQEDGGQDAPDQMVEDEDQDGAAPTGAARRPRLDAMAKPVLLLARPSPGRSAACRLPQKRVSSTLALVIAAPGILRFGPHSSLGELGVEPEHLVGAGLQLLALQDLGQEHGEAVDLGVGRLLDLDLLPALADVVEADRRAVARPSS